MKRRIEDMSEAECAIIEAAHDDACRSVLPADWRNIKSFANASSYTSRGGLRVILECEMHDTDVWLHVSYSRQDRMPSYEDTKLVKDLFIGQDRKAIMVLPKKSEHYSYHEFCLHLYSPLGRDPLPDFRNQDGQL